MATGTRKVVGPGTDEDVVNLDFTKLTPRGGGRAARVPPGDYLLELVEAKNVEINKQPGRRQVAAQLRIVGTPDSVEARAGLGDTVYTNLQVMPESKGLWFTRNFLDDLTGKETTGKAFQLTLKDKIGKRVGATLIDGDTFTDRNGEETYRSEIKYTFPAERFTGATSGGASKAADNGMASPEDAAEAVADTSDEEEEDIPIQSLENI